MQPAGARAAAPGATTWRTGPETLTRNGATLSRPLTRPLAAGISYAAFIKPSMVEPHSKDLPGGPPSLQEVSREVQLARPGLPPCLPLRAPGSHWLTASAWQAEHTRCSLQVIKGIQAKLDK
jgi:hypothetical protein